MASRCVVFLVTFFSSGYMGTYAQTSPSLAQIPGMGTFVRVVNDGGFFSHLDKPCKGVPALSNACVTTMKTLPAVLDRILPLTIQDLDNTEKLEALTAEFPNVEEVCTACDINEVREYIASAETVFTDQTAQCGGLFPDIVSAPDVLKLLTIGFETFCAKRDDTGDYCTDYSALLPLVPLALDTLGTLGINMTTLQPSEIRGLIDNLVQPTTIIAILQSPTVPALTSVYRESGCCSTMMRDVIYAILEITCLDTPIMRGGLDAMFGVISLGANLPTACSNFNMPSYYNKPPEECPTFSESMEKVAVYMENVAQSEANYVFDCYVIEGECPKNICELFTCEVVE